MMRLLLALLLLPLQDPDRPSLILRLGDPSPAVREKAMKDLEAQGDRAETDLRQALKSEDPEIRTRAESLLFQLEQRRWLGALRDGQRHAKLGLPPAPDTPDGVLAETDGVRFGLKRDEWCSKGKVLGTRFLTDAAPAPGVEVDWTIAAVRDGTDFPMETCRRHSPGIVYVPGEPPPQAQVVLRGTRRWICDVPLEFRLPADGDSRRIRDYVVSVRWPELIVRSDNPVAQGILDQVLREQDLTATLKPGRDRNTRMAGGGIRLSVVSRCGPGIPQQPPPTWCGCPGQPSQAPPVPEPTGQQTRVRERSLSMYALEDIASIRLIFHLPIEEAFEVTSPPLK
ncbi:MAG TPA: hypothetical protein VKW04_20265 [Planctomycetota bacterium]|nr:hypothetical protein [Planctomycetota bacterium]